MLFFTQSFINLKLFFNTNAYIKFPKTLNDKFIFVASFNCSPAVPAFLQRSEPARSIKFNFEFFFTNIYEL